MIILVWDHGVGDSPKKKMSRAGTSAGGTNGRAGTGERITPVR